MQETSSLSKTQKTLIVIGVFTLVNALILLVSNSAKNYQYEQAKLYNTAIQAVDKNMFNYALDSQQGNVFTTTEFTTTEPVTHPDITGEYYTIKKTEERYSEHTRYYECGTEDSPQTCSEDYYTWDTKGSENLYSPTLTFHERTYPSNKFTTYQNNRVYCENIKENCKNNYKYEKDRNWFFGDSVGDKRWYYTVTNTTFTGTILINTKDGTLNPFNGSNTIFIYNTSIEEMIKDKNSTTETTVITIILFIITCLISGLIIKEIYYDQI